MTETMMPAAMTNDVVLQAISIGRHYNDGEQRIDVLKGVDLSIRAGELVAIVGASGSGKSTLLHCLGLLDRPDSGEVYVRGKATSDMKEVARSHLRNQRLGFVYQFHHLLREFNALDNVAMPLVVRGTSLRQARAAARPLLVSMGLEKRVDHYPGQLSGGERQRVALARALVASPDCVLADEPTGNLDRRTAQHMFEMIETIKREHAIAVVVVTHDLELAARADRVLNMVDGVLTELETDVHARLHTPT
jgi:lipoprotein-releasing system ATP-binding protein